MATPQKWSSPTLTAQSRAAEAFVANVAAATALLSANARGATLGRDPGYLHQIRVGIRRLRSTLRVFRKLVRKRPARRFDGTLRTVMRRLGEARDWDVFLDAHRQPALLRGARRDAAQARRTAATTLRSGRFRALAGELLTWTGSAPWKSGADPRELAIQLARRSLDRLHADLGDCARGIDWTEAERRHRVRIRVKRLRYGCESFSGAWPEQTAQPYLGRLRELQEILGELNDIRVQRGLLARFEDHTQSDIIRGAGIRLTRRERVLAGSLGRAWRTFMAVKPYWRRRPATARASA